MAEPTRPVTGSARATPLRDFSQSLPMLLLRAHQAVMAQFRPILREHGVTEQQWRVLRALFDSLPMRASGVSAATLISGPSLTRILRGLEERGLVRREIEIDDARAASIAITSAGRALIERVGPHSEARYAGIAERLGDDTLRELYRVLADFGRRLDEPAADEPADEPAAEAGEGLSGDAIVGGPPRRCR